MRWPLENFECNGALEIYLRPKRDSVNAKPEYCGYKLVGSYTIIVITLGNRVPYVDSGFVCS